MTLRLLILGKDFSRNVSLYLVFFLRCALVITVYSSIRKLPEKMALGALFLECDNSEFWVALGCMSDNSALKLHALIRALHLDVSLAVAWAFMGQVLSH